MIEPQSSTSTLPFHPNFLSSEISDIYDPAEVSLSRGFHGGNCCLRKILVMRFFFNKILFCILELVLFMIISCLFIYTL